MAKAIKKKSAKEASGIFHGIMAASVKGNPKPNNMTEKKVQELKDDMLKKHTKHISTIEENNSGGISTSKTLYLSALKEWEDAVLALRNKNREK